MSAWKAHHDQDAGAGHGIGVHDPPSTGLVMNRDPLTRGIGCLAKVAAAPRSLSSTLDPHHKPGLAALPRRFGVVGRQGQVWLDGRPLPLDLTRL